MVGVGEGGGGSALATRIALYLSTIFLGAGLMSLPIQAAKIGGGLLFLMLMISGAISIFFYIRVATRLVGEDADSGGGEAIGRIVSLAGGGLWAPLLALSGVGIYVIGASYSYAGYGSGALLAIADEFDPGLDGAWPATVLGLVLAGLHFQLPERMVISRRLSVLMAIWSVGLGLIVLDGGDTYRTVMSLSTFVVGTLVIILSGARQAPARHEEARDADDEPTTLEAPHQTAVTGLLIQLVLMGVLLVIAFAVVAHGSRHFSWTSMLPDGPLGLSDFIKPIDTIAFALVGTGLVVMNSYRPMAEAAYRKKVVVRALVVVLSALSIWLLASTVIFGHTALADLDEEDLNTSVGMAVELAPNGGPAAVAMTVIGSLVTLIAVSGATCGFNSSLVSEAIGTVGAFRPGRGKLRKRSSEVVVAALVAASACAAGFATSSGNVLSSVIAVAGIAGGGVVLFILPMLAVGEDGKRKIWAVAAGLTGVVCAGFAYVVVHHEVHGVFLGIVMGVASLPAALTIPAAWGVARFVPAPPATVRPEGVRVYVTRQTPGAAQAPEHLIFPLLVNPDQAVFEQARAERKEGGDSTTTA